MWPVLVTTNIKRPMRTWTSCLLKSWTLHHRHLSRKVWTVILWHAMSILAQAGHWFRRPPRSLPILWFYSCFILHVHFYYISPLCIHFNMVSFKNMQKKKSTECTFFLEQPYFYSSISILFSIIPIMFQKYISTIYLPYLYVSLLCYFYNILCLNISKYFNWKYVALF